MIFGGFDLSLLNPFNNKSLSIDFLAYKGGLRNYLHLCSGIFSRWKFINVC